MNLAFETDLLEHAKVVVADFTRGEAKALIRERGCTYTYIIVLPGRLVLK